MSFVWILKTLHIRQHTHVRSTAKQKCIALLAYHVSNVFWCAAMASALLSSQQIYVKNGSISSLSSHITITDINPSITLLRTFTLPPSHASPFIRVQQIWLPPAADCAGDSDTVGDTIEEHFWVRVVLWCFY